MPLFFMSYLLRTVTHRYDGLLMVTPKRQRQKQRQTFKGIVFLRIVGWGYRGKATDAAKRRGSPDRPTWGKLGNDFGSFFEKYPSKQLDETLKPQGFQQVAQISLKVRNLHLAP